MIQPPAFTIAQVKDNVRKSFLNLEAYMLLLDEWEEINCREVTAFDMRHLHRQITKELRYLVSASDNLPGTLQIKQKVVLILDKLDRLGRRCPALEDYLPRHSDIGL